MLKSFDELIQVDVKPFCDLRDAKDEKGNVIKVPYADENGVEGVSSSMKKAEILAVLEGACSHDIR